MPMAKASEAIHSLKPVTFRYKKEVDPTGVLSFGLIAEEVAMVNPDLVHPTTKETGVRPLRGYQRNVTQRVPERASES